MSKCLDDELYDIYIEDGKQIIESLREIYEKGRADAIDEVFCLAKENCYDDGVDYSIGLQVLDNLIEQLKEKNNG